MPSRQLFSSAFHLGSARWQFWKLAAFIVFVFFTGGASRDDVLSLPILRAVCAATLVWILIIRPGDLRKVRLQLWLLLGAALFVALELLPLPPLLWQALPGRRLISQIDQAAGLQEVWRPLSLTPHASMNALFSLLLPAACFARIAATRRQANESVVKLFVAMIVIGAALGLLQLLTGSGGGLYLYSITNSDSSVGFMANRNHHALLLACGMPMLAYLIGNLAGPPRKVYPWQSAAVVLAIILFPFIALTGSRAGLVLAVVGLAGALLVYREPVVTGRRIPAMWKRLNSKAVWLAFAAAAVVLSLLAGRITAFDRLAPSGTGDVDRLALLPFLWKMIGDYFPYGAGGGSFPDAFRLYESDALLQPAYYNHAHNDVLEPIIEHGVAGAVAIAALVAVWIWTAWRVWRQRRRAGPSATNALALTGLTILLECGLSSLVDYPLRVPIVQMLACFSVVWVCDTLRADPRESKVAWARKGSDDLVERTQLGTNQ